MQYIQTWLDAAKTQLNLQLSGSLQFGKFQELQSFIFDLKEDPPAHITFDLAEVDLIDSSGLGLLIIANEITGHNKRITLINANETIIHLLEVCKMDKLMKIE